MTLPSIDYILLVGTSIMIVDREGGDRHAIASAHSAEAARFVAHAVADTHNRDLFEAPSAYPSTPKLVEKALGLGDITGARADIINEVADRLNEWLGSTEEGVSEVSIVGKLRSYANEQ